jgi:hypothetical protein
MAGVDKAGAPRSSHNNGTYGREGASHTWLEWAGPRSLRPGSTVDVTHRPITGWRLHCWTSVLALAQPSMYNTVQHNDIQSG